MQPVSKDGSRNPSSTNDGNFDVQELKRRVSSRLLEIPGVSGVGVRGGILTVYLAEDSEAVRQAVAAVLESERPGVSVNYVVSGVFRAQ